MRILEIKRLSCSNMSSGFCWVSEPYVLCFTPGFLLVLIHQHNLCFKEEGTERRAGASVLVFHLSCVQALSG